MMFLVFIARFLIVIPLIIFGIYLILKKDKITFLKMGLGVIVINVLSEVFKFLIPLQRPFVGQTANPGIWVPFGYGSFFSAHTGTLFVLGTLFWKKNKKIALTLFIFGLIIGALRVIIKVHYPVDIIGGVLIGILVGLIVTKF